MIIIGERINASRKSMGEAIQKKDVKFIQQEAINQVNAGADLIDVNCGMNPETEVSDMEWLVKIVQEVVDVPLCIDSPNPEAIKAGVKAHKGKPLVNSISGEGDKVDTILPLVSEHGTDVVALTINDNGMPKTAEDRLKVAQSLLKTIDKYNIPHESVYFDLLVRSVATEPEQGLELLKSIALIKSTLGVKTVCALSNVSFGLPGRINLNSTFTAMAIGYGLDAGIMDPTNSKMIIAMKAGEALTGKDEYCLGYINAFREGKLV